jgi:hypothetical protein
MIESRTATPSSRTGLQGAVVRLESEQVRPLLGEPGGRPSVLPGAECRWELLAVFGGLFKELELPFFSAEQVAAFPCKECERPSSDTTTS